MSERRRVSYWLKMIGASDWPLHDYPFRDRPSLKTEVRFPRDQFPGRLISKGDSLVYYAVGGWKRVFAIVELTEDPQRDVRSGDAQVDKRWPHAATVLLSPYWVEPLTRAPLLSDVSQSLQSEIHQGVSHIPMGAPKFERAKEAIRRARAGVARP
jgi:hypothetical protein